MEPVGQGGNSTRFLRQECVLKDELNLLLNKMNLDLPAQPPPKITAEPMPPTPL
jgi:hypothetical protein